MAQVVKLTNFGETTSILVPTAQAVYTEETPNKTKVQIGTLVFHVSEDLTAIEAASNA